MYWRDSSCGLGVGVGSCFWARVGNGTDKKQIWPVQAIPGEDLALARWPMASRNWSGPVKNNVTGLAWPITF